MNLFGGCNSGMVILPEIFVASVIVCQVICQWRSGKAGLGVVGKIQLTALGKVNRLSYIFLCTFLAL